jgi:serine/threonine protein phosphatase PrpC
MHDVFSWFETGAATHVGKMRQLNEDHLLVRPNVGLWAVADGMGGLEAGDLASHTIIEALETVEAPISAAALLADCETRIAAANSRLRVIAAERHVGMIGSTLVLLLAYKHHYAAVWSGDSRIYRVRGGEIEQITVDHSEVQALIDAGKLTPQEARTWPRRNVITRAIGVSDEPELELTQGPLMPGDIFVLCSDGLTNHVEDHEILAAVAEAAPQQGCDRLVALTLDRGATDNVTVVVVRYDLDAPAGALGAADAFAGAEDVWG